jgi:hypothetical protein
MDKIARDYLLLALSVGELEDGIVDSYYGPPDVRAAAVARGAGAAELASEAASLRDRVQLDTDDDQRRRWLDRQLVALETICRRLAAEQLPYVDEVERCFDAPPTRTPASVYSRVRRELDELLPGAGSLHDRREARDERLTIPVDRVGPILDWLVGEIRQICAAVFPVPAGESLTLSLVTNEPWSAYNWYDGQLRSRVEFNTDLPTRAHALPYTLTHETFPGHHVEHAWKEQRLVLEEGRAECSVQLINTPEAYISEGLAEVGGKLLIDGERWQSLLISIADQAGIAITAQDAEREWRTSVAAEPLRGLSGDAALMLHAEGRSRDEVKEFLVEDGLTTPARADKSLEFIEHPLWRTYVFCYAGGEQLLTGWCRAAGDERAQRERFFRLLTEQLTPSGIAEEMAAT